MNQDDRFAYYVYGITFLTGCSIGGIGWAAMTGVDGDEPVYAIPQMEHPVRKEIQAVVSRVSLDSFDPTTLPGKIQDTAWLQEKVLAHEHVIRTVFTGHTIIPMKFGTLFETKEGVLAMLAEHYDEFLFLLAYLEDKEEWGVKLFADRERLRQEIEENDPVLNARSVAIARKGAGAAYLLRQKLNDQLIARVEQVLAESSQYAYTRLSSRAVEGCVLNLQPPEITGRSEEMILHAAFLVEKECVPDFIGQVWDLEVKYSWWEINCTGPWAPYNFLTEPFDKLRAGCKEVTSV